MDRSKKNLKDIFDIRGDSTLAGSEKEQLYTTIMKDVRRKRIFRLLWQSSAVAAVLLLGLTFLFIHRAEENHMPDIQEIARRSRGAFVENNTVQIASLDIAQKSLALKSLYAKEAKEDTKLSIQAKADKTHYSTIYVPYGKRQEVILPDGSTVWLNAGSYLTFNSNMVQGNREVYLNGEGFFNIKHTGSRFTVRTAQADINVLGTSFNASSYEDEAVFSIELLSGKVELNSPQKKFKSITMKPGERVAVNSQKNTVDITRNTAGDDMLWTKKQLALKNVKIRDLLKRMERIYNVKINADEEVYNMDIGYSGRLNVGVDIVTSLGSIYELRNYTIILKEKEVSIIQKE